MKSSQAQSQSKSTSKSREEQEHGQGQEHGQDDSTSQGVKTTSSEGSTGSGGGRSTPSKSGVLKIKRAHAPLLWGNKWESQRFRVDETRDALVTEPVASKETPGSSTGHGTGTGSSTEVVIPFSDIKQVNILADAEGYHGTNNSNSGMNDHSNASGAGASTNASTSANTNTSTSTSTNTSTSSGLKPFFHHIGSTFGALGAHLIGGTNKEDGLSHEDQNASSKNANGSGTTSGTKRGGGFSSFRPKLRLHTRFVVELRETSSSLPGGTRIVLQAKDEKEAREWVDVLTERACQPHISIVKEDIQSNIRHFYDLHPHRTVTDEKKQGGGEADMQAEAETEAEADRIKPPPGKETLGTGMSGEVRLVRRLKDNKYFAMKAVNLSRMTSRQLQSLQNEIDILKSLDHPHIAKLYETYTEHGLCVRMILELCEGGELFDRLMKYKRFSEHYTAQLAHRMLGVLSYLHENSIAHRDLKLENWLFRTKNPKCTEIVLIDFGLSKKFKPGEHMHATVGTSYYVSPSTLSGDYEGTAEDLWSLGVILFMLLAGVAPFDGPDDEAILDSVRHAEKNMPKMKSGVWRNISNEAKLLIRGLLTVDPNKRLTADDALKHEWFQVEKTDTIDDVEVDQTVLQRLKRFAQYGELKRVAMEVVAHSLEHDEIKDLTKVFESLDSDHNGYITLGGLKRALQKHHKIEDAEVERIFEALDEEHKGLVSVNEFIAATLEERYFMDEHYLYDAFMQLDTTNSGYITVEALRKLLGSTVTAERAEHIIEEAELEDHDGEHKISYQEFLRFMRSNGEDAIDALRADHSR